MHSYKLVDVFRRIMKLGEVCVWCNKKAAVTDSFTLYLFVLFLLTSVFRLSTTLHSLCSLDFDWVNVYKIQTFSLFLPPQFSWLGKNNIVVLCSIMHSNDHEKLSFIFLLVIMAVLRSGFYFFYSWYILIEGTWIKSISLL